MTVYSPVAILRIWLRNGGSINEEGLVAVCAVALAESGGRSDAVSPAWDYGLWQINRIHFATFGVNSRTVLNIDTNAKIAIALSANGDNWAPWCTAWDNPAANCGHGHLGFPQPHSAAAFHFPEAEAAASAVSNNPRVIPKHPVSPTVGAVANVWTDTQEYQNHGAPKQYADLTNLRVALRKVQ